MLISFNWINELINIEDINLDELIEKLTLGGFEVEDTFEVSIGKKKETVLEISATANRADSIFAKGIAKEIGALLNKPILENPYAIKSFEPEQILQNSFSNNQIVAKYNCSTFIAIKVENLENCVSPEWLKQKLISSDIEPVNNLLDFQNYILLETGYPFEFYDLEKIQQKLQQKDFNVILTNGTNVEQNNTQYSLDEETLILKTDELFVSVAGLTSTDEFAYDSTSKSILIEGSIFGSKKIRQTSRKLGLRTDRSARYEKGLNNCDFNNSICRLLNLLRINNPKINYKIHSIGQIPEKQVDAIVLNYKNIIEILGPTQVNKQVKPVNIDIKEITSYLERLNFTFTFEPETQSWKVSIPSSRIDDLTREIDLIEEIGRLHGFNNFVSYLPPIKTIGFEDFSYQTRKKLTTCFLSEGLNELMQYSLVKTEIDNIDSLNLVNPLISDCSSLRTSLLPNILNTLEENLKQGNRNIEGFEFGHIFTKDSKNNYLEKESVGGNFGGITTKTNWSETATNLSWFEAKGKLENILLKLNIVIIWKPIISKSCKELLHPYRTAEFSLLNGQPLGIFGQVHPITAKNLNLNSDIYLFEFDFTVLKNELKNNLLPLYKEYSYYPKIIKDLSFIIRNDIPFSKVKDLILRTGTDVLTNVELLDEYKGTSIPLDSTSLCIQLTFQSNKKTLRTKEVEKIVNAIQEQLVKKYKIVQRV
jgi:phenylalanyl-tRNA synthetase beta chain